MNLGAPEIIGIIVLALLLFGSRKLPELGSSVGKTITNFKQGMSEAKAEEEAKAEQDTPQDTGTSDAVSSANGSVPSGSEATERS